MLKFIKEVYDSLSSQSMLNEEEKYLESQAEKLLKLNSKTFIFYTDQGTTEGPREQEVENGQSLGTARGVDNHDAFENLIVENPWIADAGFTEFYVHELVNVKDLEYFNLEDLK